MATWALDRDSLKAVVLEALREHDGAKAEARAEARAEKAQAQVQEHPTVKFLPAKQGNPSLYVDVKGDAGAWESLCAHVKAQGLHVWADNTGETHAFHGYAKANAKAGGKLMHGRVGLDNPKTRECVEAWAKAQA